MRYRDPSLSETANREARVGILTILNDHGDVKVEWDPDDRESTDKAKAEFDRLKKDGYRFYSVEETRGKAVDKFDPKAGKLLAAPGARSTDDKAAGTRARGMAGGPVAGTPVRL